MQTPVVIIPDPKKNPFLERLSGEGPHPLAGYSPERVVISPGSRRVRITLSGAVEPVGDLRRSIDAFMQAVLPEAGEIELEFASCGRQLPGSPADSARAEAPERTEPVAVDEAATVESLVLGQSEAIREHVCAQAPAARGWLDAGRFRAEGDLVVVETIDEIGARSLRDRKVDVHVAEWFAARRRPARVMIEVATDAEALRRSIGEKIDKESASMPQAPNGYPAPSSGKKEKRANADGVYYGRRFANPMPVPIGQVTQGSGESTIEGRVFSSDRREVRNGKVLITFNLTDGSDSITAKLFEKKEKAPDLPDGAWVILRGKPEHDDYIKETVIVPRDIFEGSPKRRADLAPVKRIELHAHTQMSALDALTTIGDYVAQANHFGHEWLALTDHGGVQAFPEFYDTIKKINKKNKEKAPPESGRKPHRLKPIFGMEGYLVNDAAERQACAGVDLAAQKKESGPSWHVVILVRNAVGLRHLYELVTLSHIEHFYRKPRIPRSELLARREGLLLGSACEAGEVYKAVMARVDDAELDRIAGTYDYLEIQPLANNKFLIGAGVASGEAELADFNRRIVDCGRRLGKPVVATCDMHFLNPEDAIYRTILQTGQHYADAENGAPLFFRTTDEMLAECAYLGEATAREVVIEAPAAIAALLDPDLAPIPDEIAFPTMAGAEEKIRSMSYAKARELYGDPLPDPVEARLKFELDCIIGNGFATLYLIAHELVKKSNLDNYLVGSRGSVGSSLVATFTGITEVNPLDPHWRCADCLTSEFYRGQQYLSGFDLPDRACPACGKPMEKDGFSIPFATFLGFEGDKTPDIDLNFSGEYQSTIHKYVEEIFGESHVYRAGTIATIQEKTAHGFVKGYLEESGASRRKAEMQRLALGITGVKRTTGQHPGGVMIVPMGRHIHEFTPINYPANDRKSGTITTHFDYNQIDKKLLKLDLLGHDDPTFIRMLQDMTGVDVFKIPFNDPETMRLFSSTETLGIPEGAIEGLRLGTLGIPEFGTSFVRGMLEDTLPSTFAELVRISGLSHGTDVWLNNAQEIIRKKVAPLAEVISVRDDIINYLMARGMDPKESFYIMENVRKGKGLKPEMEASMRKSRIPAWYIDSCNKIKYMFPKAHAAAYVMMAFRIAYFKVHHREAYYAVYFSTKGTAFSAGIVLKGLANVKQVKRELNERIDNKENTAKDEELLTVLEVVEEAMVRGVKFLPIDLYASDANRFLLKGTALLPPFTSIDGLGANAALKLVAGRADGPFISIEDFKKRTGLSKSVVESLKSLGCFADIPETDQLELF